MQQMHRREAETIRHVPAEARRLRQDLRQATREGGLILAFQARRRLLDEAPLGADAHISWPSRGRGVMHGNALAALTTECGLAEDVLAWTLHAACTEAAAWRGGVVSVGAPAWAARDGCLLRLVADALTASALPPEHLEIALHDAEVDGDCAGLLFALAALRDLGMGVALDAFGRDHACLIKLRHLPVTTIKLDCSLVRDAALDLSAAAMARALIGYAHALDIEVAAAVETGAQRALLRDIGCDAGIERKAFFSEEKKQKTFAT